jgi:hypothetical protein
MSSTEMLFAYIVRADVAFPGEADAPLACELYMVISMESNRMQRTRETHDTFFFFGDGLNRVHVRSSRKTIANRD